ncbi:dienelactone hydrolase family protein [Mesorhizobium sp. LHD-90]|uniref:alpha/beta hydrolase n=1 Tax=Mesorhizobium sp. LHD-90 TaxID=3071414 RepID=UPI0027E02CF0|nr:dienelactone hydrolase family protein [Mesorhizobium sp. LHD-90]MDQ6433284.1 dienelactone hydrolase family protein [Mesorhizobium sp. LHD-90]
MVGVSNVAAAGTEDAVLRLGAMPAHADALCVFVHGRGQSPEEMGEHVIARLRNGSAHVVLPRAQDSVWYDARAVDPLTEQTMAQLQAGLDAIDAAVALAISEGAPGDRVVLAGFSQGACLSLEYALRRPRRLRGLVAFTGCRVGGALRAQAATFLDGLPAYLSCGDADPWIPLGPFFEAAQDLAEAGAALRVEIFPGRVHEVLDAEIAALDAILVQVVAGRAAPGARRGAVA